jgi:threonine dehydrogenase-like Zn-dependent dehydrogenase
MIWKDHEFGHEAISEVVEVGYKVKDLAVGDHVFVNQGQALRDMRRMATVGGFSNYIRIPQCEVGYSVLKIDNDLPLTTAVLFEPFVIGTRGVKGIDPGPGKSAIVFGAGIIGLATAVMLQWLGCGKVMVVDISDYRLGKARDLGFAVCNPQSEDLKAKAHAELGVKRDFHGERCAATLYVDAVGAGPVIDSFADLAPRGASLAIIGVHHAPVPLDLVKVCYSNWKIHGCGDIRIEDALGEILAMMRSGRWDLASLVTHEYPVEQINEALTMAGNAGEAQKVCIAF